MPFGSGRVFVRVRDAVRETDYACGAKREIQTWAGVEDLPEFDPERGAACVALLIEALPSVYDGQHLMTVDRAFAEHGLCARTAAVIQDKYGYLELCDDTQD